MLVGKMGSSCFDGSIKRVLISTGNILECKELTLQVYQSLIEELIQSVQATFSKWIQSGEKDQKDAELEIINKDIPPTISSEDRGNLKITVKIFLTTFDANKVKEATTKVLKHLGVEGLDSLILAFPVPSPPTKLSLENIQPIWEAAEELVEEKSTATIGVSDLDTTQLKELYSLAKVKPNVNQVNLESCCVIPQEMAEFAKANSIQLLTHSDPKVVLRSDDLSRLLQAYISNEHGWSADWVVRYSALVKCRGIIQSKGYIVSLVQTNN